MNELNAQNEKPKDKRRSSQELYDMLKRCSDKKDMTEWNQWRKEYPDVDIWLQNKDFKNFWLKKVNFIGETVCKQFGGKNINYTGKVHLEGATFEYTYLEQAVFAKAHLERSCFWYAKVRGGDFRGAHLKDAKLQCANFEICDFQNATLENARFTSSKLNGAELIKSDLRGCSLRACVVDGATQFWNCIINRYAKDKKFTDLTGTALDNVLITSGQKQLLEYNIRRQSWEEWYKEHSILKWLVKPFWWISDYGISTKRAIFTFCGLAGFFAVIYSNWAHWFPPGIVDNLEVEPHLPLWHYGILVFLRPIYFSVVTMTTLGFGDMYANAQSIWGHILLTIQVILGYVLLGALVTRFAVLFTAGGPAGTFADDEGQKTDDREQKTYDGGRLS